MCLGWKQLGLLIMALKLPMLFYSTYCSKVKLIMLKIMLGYTINISFVIIIILNKNSLAVKVQGQSEATMVISDQKL